MQTKCPSKSHPSWLALVEKTGSETNAYKEYIKNGMEIPVVENNSFEQFQKLTEQEKNQSVKEITEKHRNITAMKDLAAKLAWRIGANVKWENRTDVDYKGYREGNTIVLNEAYMTGDTPFHEILGHLIIEEIKNTNPTLYNELIKELETGEGKKVFEQVKKDYSELSVEQQKEEAIVQLLGMLAEGKLDAVKDKTLIQKLRAIWNSISDLVKSLLKQDGIVIKDLPITTTLSDIAEIMAYGNNKLIRDGYKVEYQTPLGNRYETLQEVNNEIKKLADSNVIVDLSGVILRFASDVSQIKEDKFTTYEVIDKLSNDGHNITIYKKNGEWFAEHPYGDDDFKLSDKSVLAYYNNNINSFIEKNKEFEQSKEIIEQWKKENNIQYDPEEVYSRGQGFYSSIGAYSNLELDLLFQNLLQHVEDNKTAGGEFTISAFTKPVDSRLKHIEGTEGKVRFKIFPKSEDIKWAAPTDVYSGSVWDSAEKVSKDKKSELLGVSFTKAPALQNVNEIVPNLASIIDNLSHAHNELAIELTKDNFEIEYDNDIPYETKKLIDNINNILKQKRGGELIEPDIIKNEKINNQFDISDLQDLEEDYADGKISKEKFEDLKKALKSYKNLPKQPTQTKETLKESIESVRDKITKFKTSFDIQELSFQILEDVGDTGENDEKPFGLFINNTDVGGNISDYIQNFETEQQAEEWVENNGDNYRNNYKEKEYTNQALINLKVATLKEVARKYPRSLITSKVVPINNNIINQTGERQYSKVNNNSFQQSLDNLNTNPILKDNQQEQVKKFAELQERLNNKEFIEGAKFAYESSEDLKSFGTQEQYNDYIARVSLGIIKNPSTGEYNDSKVKDIFYHSGAIDKNSKFDRNKIGPYSYHDLFYFSNSKFFTKINTKLDLVKYYFIDQVFKDDKIKIKNANSINDIYDIFLKSSAFEKSTQKEIKLKNAKSFLERADREYEKDKGKIKGGWYKGTYTPERLIAAVVNIKNPYTNEHIKDRSLDEINKNKKQEEGPTSTYILNKQFDSYIVDSDINLGVKNPEQIHILSSKADIEGFKNYTNVENKQYQQLANQEESLNVQKVNNISVNLNLELEDNISTIYNNGEDIGTVATENDGEYLKVYDINITEKNRGQGIGPEVYKLLGYKSLELGLTLKSDVFNRMNEYSTGLWDKLVEEELAEKYDNYYLFTGKEENNNKYYQDSNSLAIRINESLPDSVKKILGTQDELSILDFIYDQLNDDYTYKSTVMNYLDNDFELANDILKYYADNGMKKNKPGDFNFDISSKDLNC